MSTELSNDTPRAESPPTLNDVRDAAKLLNGRIARTPLIRAFGLEDGLKDALKDVLKDVPDLDAEIRVKHENFQPTNSFKDRGAYVRLHRLADDRRRKGVIAMSAGNHAQAVARHAQNLGIPAVIVMPETSPFTKIERTRRFGAEVILHGQSLDDAVTLVDDLIEKRGLTLAHPFDDDDVIAAQGSVALEMLEDAPDLDVLAIPIGGGGLIAGCAIAAKAIKPDIQVIGAEAQAYPSMTALLDGREPVCGGSTLADGIAVKKPAERTVNICRRLVDDIVLAPESDIERAVHLLLSRHKTVAEGAGAAGLAAMLAAPEKFKGKKVGVVLCGGNIDPRVLASVAYRELEREQRIVTLRVTIDDRPGMLGQIAVAIGASGANILEVAHRRLFLDVPARGADLDFMIETRDAPHGEEIVADLRDKGFRVARLSASHEDGSA